MKRVLLTLVFVCTFIVCSAQMRTAYFMEGSYFRTDMNPALMPTRGYIALPMLSGVGVGLNNNFMSIDNFFYNRDNQTVFAFDTKVSADEFLRKMPNTATVGAQTNINILGVGFAAKGMFWNFGLNLRANAEVSFAKDYFRTLKSLGNGEYDFSSAAVDGSAYCEVYVGTALSIYDWLTVGARLKGLIGIVNVNAKGTMANISVTSSEISGVLRASMRGSGAMINPKYLVGSELNMDTLIDTSLIDQNVNSGGFAVDLGAEAKFLDDNLKVSAAITDLGFIKWSGKSAASADITADFYYRGVDFDSGDVDADGDVKAVMVDANGGYTKRLNCTLNMGAEYNVLDNHIAFGLLSHTEFRQTHTVSELTASVNFRLGKNFTTSLSHTFCGRNRPGVFGFALNGHPTGFNFFIGMDFIDTTFVKYQQTTLIPKYLKSCNFYFGIGFNLGKNKIASIID